jgi:hypothetical protein
VEADFKEKNGAGGAFSTAGNAKTDASSDAALREAVAYLLGRRPPKK